MFEEIFRYKKPITDRLIKYGFIFSDGLYRYSALIPEINMILTVTISETGNVDTMLTDNESNDEYTLYKMDFEGAFIGKVRELCSIILKDISTNCFQNEIFKSGYTKKLIQYFKNTYGDDPEFLWEKFPENAVFRRKDSQKWYAIIMTVDKSKLGLNGEKCEIVDFKIPPEEKENIIDGINIFPGYHMNKKSWITICLDGSVSFENIKVFADISYRLAANSKK